MIKIDEANSSQTPTRKLIVGVFRLFHHKWYDFFSSILEMPFLLEQHISISIHIHLFFRSIEQF